MAPFTSVEVIVPSHKVAELMEVILDHVPEGVEVAMYPLYTDEVR